MSKNTFTFKPDLCWLSDADQVQIVDRQQQKSFNLTGTEAALWQLLQSGLQWQECTGILWQLQNCEETERLRLAQEILRKWLAEGLIILNNEAADEYQSID